MATKLGKVVINHEELPVLKLLDIKEKKKLPDHSIMWFCKVT